MSSYTFFAMKNVYKVKQMNSGSSKIKKFRHNVGQNWYHVVLVTKFRGKVFQWDITNVIAREELSNACEKHSIELYTLEVMSDHAHLFVACPPDMPIRRMLRLIKGASSYHIRRRYPSLKKYKHLWNRGAMYRSVGSVSAEVVERYIKRNDWGSIHQKKLI